MPNRPITQYDENMNVIAKYSSQEDAVVATGISDHRMRKSRKNNKPMRAIISYLIKIIHVTKSE